MGRCATCSSGRDGTAEDQSAQAFRVMIDPLVVGGGKSVFRDDGVLRPLRLDDHQVTTTGAILATYAVDRQ